MNEVTKVHLGRIAFTISVDAHNDLKNYIDEIKKQVKDKDVLDEIELRMAELLTEHGINGKKVVLVSDIDYLKSQLGSPKDFGDEEAETEEGPTGKRLFRDMDNAMIAGVASGLAKYFGIDAIIIRLIFIVLIIATAGWAILLYVILWLLVPEARTSSDRLRMAGKAVTVENLKHLVVDADVKGVAGRTGSTIAEGINGIFRVILKALGIAFVLFGLSAIFGLISFGIYFSLNANQWSKYNIFPVGFKEHFLLYLVAAVIALIAIFIILFGIAIFSRKWPIHAWVTGVLIGLILIAISASGSLVADVYPGVRDRYNADTHTSERYVPAFNSVYINNWDTNINFQPSNKYFVSLKYFSHPNLSSVKTQVVNNVLEIDSSNFNMNRKCPIICIPNSYQLIITINSPQALQLMNAYDNGPGPQQMLKPMPPM